MTALNDTPPRPETPEPDPVAQLRARELARLELELIPSCPQSTRYTPTTPEQAAAHRETLLAALREPHRAA